MLLFVKCDCIGGQNAITAQPRKKLTGKFCTLRGLCGGDDQPERTDHPPSHVGVRMMHLAPTLLGGRA